MSVRILLVLSFCLTGILKAQNDLTIVSENGEPFWLYLNGQKVNDSAQAIVTAAEVKRDTCGIRVTYLNPNVSTFGAKVYLLQRGKSCKNLSFRYAIGTIKGKTALKYISTDYIMTGTADANKKPSEYINGVFTSVKQQEDAKNRLAEKYPAPVVCSETINDSLLQKHINILKKNHIERARSKDAKWFISHNCLSVSQIKKLIAIFDYEEFKYSLLEFLYDYLYDKDNFLQLADMLNYGFDKEKIKKFYDNKKSP